MLTSRRKSFNLISIIWEPVIEDEMCRNVCRLQGKIKKHIWEVHLGAKGLEHLNVKNVETKLQSLED
jgi:hypothetical protein